MSISSVAEVEPFLVVVVPFYLVNLLCSSLVGILFVTLRLASSTYTLATARLRRSYYYISIGIYLYTSSVLCLHLRSYYYIYTVALPLFLFSIRYLKLIYLFEVCYNTFDLYYKFVILYNF